MITPAIDRLGGTHTETDVVAMLLSGHMQLWDGGDAAIITEFIQYPRKRVISTFAAGGNKERLHDLKPHIEHYGRINGCQAARIIGRKGWEREHPDYSFESVSLTKEI